MPPRRELIEDTADACGWVKAKTAAKLGVSRPTLDAWCRDYGIRWLYGADRKDRKGGRSVKAAQPENRADTYTRKDVNQSAPPNGFRLRLADAAPTLTREMASAAMTGTVEDPRVPTNSRMVESLWKRTRKHAIDEGCNASDIIERAVREYFERLDQKDGQK